MTEYQNEKIKKMLDARRAKRYVASSSEDDFVVEEPEEKPKPKKEA